MLIYYVVLHVFERIITVCYSMSYDSVCSIYYMILCHVILNKSISKCKSVYEIIVYYVLYCIMLS